MKDIAAQVRAAAEQLGVDPALALAVAHTESKFDPTAVSPKGARGTMQVMPATARELRTRHGDDNVLQGVGYLKELTERFKDPKLAIAAYNAGPTRVARAIERSARTGRPVEDFLPAETQTYVQRVTATIPQFEVDPAGAPPEADPQVAEKLANLGVRTLNDLVKLPGFDRLSPEAQREVALRAGFDVRALPPQTLAQLFTLPPPPAGGPEPAGRMTLPGAAAAAIESRFVDPLRQLFSPQSSWVERGLAGANVALTAIPGTWPATGAGLVASTAANWLFEEPEFGALLGGVVELLSAPVSLARPASRGRRMLSAAQREGEAMAAQTGMPAPAAIGESLRTLVRRGIKTAAERANADFEAVAQALRRVPELRNIDDTLPEYTALLRSIEEAVLSGSITPDLPHLPRPLADELFTLYGQLKQHANIPAADLLTTLRKLQDYTPFVDPNNPNIARYLGAGGRIIDDMRSLIGAHLDEIASRAPQFKPPWEAWQRGIHTWRSQVKEPRRILRMVLGRQVSPREAFTRLFPRGDDPHRFAAAAKLLNDVGMAGARDKLRLGFLQTLADKSQDFENITKALRMIEANRSMLTSLKLFTPRELDDMVAFFKRKSITNLKALFSPSDPMARTAAARAVTASAVAGAGAALHQGVMGRDPITGEIGLNYRSVIIAALTLGLGPALLRQAVLPRDPRARAEALARLGEGMTNVLARIAASDAVIESEDAPPTP